MLGCRAAAPCAAWGWRPELMKWVPSPSQRLPAGCVPTLATAPPDKEQARCSAQRRGYCRAGCRLLRTPEVRAARLLSWWCVEAPCGAVSLDNEPHWFAGQWGQGAERPARQPGALQVSHTPALCPPKWAASPWILQMGRENLLKYGLCCLQIPGGPPQASCPCVSSSMCVCPGAVAGSSLSAPWRGCLGLCQSGEQPALWLYRPLLSSHAGRPRPLLPPLTRCGRRGVMGMLPGEAVCRNPGHQPLWGHVSTE